LAFVKSKEAMKNLFGDLAERYKERSGGYSRIMALGPRRGDAAPMALMILVDSAGDPFSDSKAKKAPARRRRKTADQVAEKVSEGKPAEEAKG